MCSGSALALSLPRDRAKERVVQSRTLGACNLSRCLLWYRTPPEFSSPCVGGGVFFCRLQRALLLLLPPPPCSAWWVLFGSCLRWNALFYPVVFMCPSPPLPPAPLGGVLFGFLPSLECLVLPSRLHVHPMHGTCWLSGLPSRIFPRLQCLCPGRLGCSLFVLRAKLSYCGFLRFGSPAPILHRFSVSSPSCGNRLPVRSRLRGVFVARTVIPHLASRFAGFVFDLPSFLIAVTVFVWPWCVTTRRLWLSSPCRTGLCPVFLCLLTCCSSVLTSTSLGFSARAVPLFWRVLLDRRDPIEGSEWLSQPGGCHSPARLGFPVVWLFTTGLPELLPLFCSSVLNRRVVVLTAFCIHWAALGLYAFHPSFCRLGGWIESGRPFSLELWSPSSAWGGCGSRSVPSPSRGSPGCLPSRQGMSVSGFRLSVGPSLGLVLQVLVLSLYRRFFLEISWCPTNLQSCVPPRGLSLSSLKTCHEICAFLLFLIERFPLPGRRSSS